MTDIVSTAHMRTVIGSRIRSARLAAGMSLGELASESKVPKALLEQVEQGHAEVSILGVLRIAGSLGITPATFVTDIGFGD